MISKSSFDNQIFIEVYKELKIEGGFNANKMAARETKEKGKLKILAILNAIFTLKKKRRKS
jgi:hypothetical protein